MGAKQKSLPIEGFFQALGDNTRLRLLNLMAEREVCVCYFVEILMQPQSKISRHLAYLRRAGVVTARREGKWMHYRIARPANSAAARVLDQTLVWIAEERVMRADREKLSKACCQPGKFSALLGAPRPMPVLKFAPLPHA